MKIIIAWVKKKPGRNMRFSTRNRLQHFYAYLWGKTVHGEK